MKLGKLELLLLGSVMVLFAGCGSVGDPIHDIQRNVETIKTAGNVFATISGKGVLPLESIGLTSPIKEVRAEDDSFTLTQTPTATIPYYSNDVGPVQTRYISTNGWRTKHAKTKTVRVVVDGQTEPLHGRLAIFPPIKASTHVTDRFNARITVTPESLAQMEKEGIGFSCTVYHQYMQDWCDWALWISKSPIPE